MICLKFSTPTHPEVHSFREGEEGEGGLDVGVVSSIFIVCFKTLFPIST